jgi:serine/threonine-protein kinase RsbW
MTPEHKEQNPIRPDYIRVETDLNAMDQVLQWFEQFNHPPLTDELWMQGQIALIEGFTNAVRHAHKNLPASTPIDLSVNISSHKLEILIWDEGPAFDLEALLAQVGQHHDPLEREAHWGGVLLKKLRDKHNWKICYNCDTMSQRNCLSMQRAFADSPSELFSPLAQ